jgi:uncharacterized protein (TIGR02145 family)
LLILRWIYNISLAMKRSFIVLVLVHIIVYSLLLFSCKKKHSPPELTTTDVTSVTQTSAVSGGWVTNEGGAPVLSKGVCWNTLESPTISNNKTTEYGGHGVFVSSINDLSPNTLYHLRAYASNAIGINYGNEVTFRTSQIEPPSVTTAEISSVSETKATTGGSVTSCNGSNVTARGVCWSRVQTPTILCEKTNDGSGAGDFVSNLVDLMPASGYFVRAYATNAAGTSYGPVIAFNTSQIPPPQFNMELSYGSLNDIDGNSYKTIQIGSQTWMAENLKTTKFNDGTDMQNVTDSATWANLSTPAYCFLFNEPTVFKATYGALYNWFAVNTGKLCPSGWHVPSDVEWHDLSLFLDPATEYRTNESFLAGGMLKESGTMHYRYSNIGATNETGFTALPGGMRWKSPEFMIAAFFGYWWSSTEMSSDVAWSIIISGGSKTLNRNSSGIKTRGYSIRCLKD